MPKHRLGDGRKNHALRPRRQTGGYDEAEAAPPSKRNTAPNLFTGAGPGPFGDARRCPSPAGACARLVVFGERCTCGARTLPLRRMPRPGAPE